MPSAADIIPALNLAESLPERAIDTVDTYRISKIPMRSNASLGFAATQKDRESD